MRSVLTLVAAGLLSTGAFAQFSQTFDTTFGPVGVNSSPFLVSLPQFDTSLGSLTSIDVVLSAQIGASTFAFDNEGVAGNVTLSGGAELEASGPSSLVVVTTPTDSITDPVDADNDGAADFVGTDSLELVYGMAMDSDVAMLMAGFTPYEGAGTVDFTITPTLLNSFSASGAFGPIDATPGDVSGTLEITYNYIPEPATMALLGLGGLTLLRRRRGS